MILDEGSGGAATVTRWIRDLFGREPGRRLWVVLDDPLGLALAQGWILGESGPRDDDLAEDLAADDSNDRRFGAMLAVLVEHWRSVYTTSNRLHGRRPASDPIAIADRNVGGRQRTPTNDGGALTRADERRRTSTNITNETFNPRVSLCA